MVSEVRRRLFVATFLADKQAATFMGRPPAMSRRHCTCKLPLDLSDDELMATGEELSSVIAKLDTNGWNMSGEAYPATYLRAWMLMTEVRDEILELALGSEAGSSQTCRWSVPCNNRHVWEY